MGGEGEELPPSRLDRSNVKQIASTGTRPSGLLETSKQVPSWEQQDASWGQALSRALRAAVPAAVPTAAGQAAPVLGVRKGAGFSAIPAAGRWEFDGDVFRVPAVACRDRRSLQRSQAARCILQPRPSTRQRRGREELLTKLVPGPPCRRVNADAWASPYSSGGCSVRTTQPVTKAATHVPAPAGLAPVPSADTSPCPTSQSLVLKTAMGQRPVLCLRGLLLSPLSLYDQPSLPVPSRELLSLIPYFLIIFFNYS